VAAFAALASILALLAIGLAGGIVWSVRRRPVDPEGPAGWTWGTGLVFAAASVAVAVLLPTVTCPAGVHLDPLFHLCISAASRAPARSWLWLKYLIAILGVIAGLTLLRSARFAGLAATVASGMWVFALAWFLKMTFAGGL
jgi:hypothetical protein